MAHHYDTLEKTTFCITMKTIEEIRGDTNVEHIAHFTLCSQKCILLKTAKKQTKTQSIKSHENLHCRDFTTVKIEPFFNHCKITVT